MAAEIPLRCRSEAKLREATGSESPRQYWLIAIAAVAHESVNNSKQKHIEK
jgi:hypothetical protein